MNTNILRKLSAASLPVLLALAGHTQFTTIPSGTNTTLSAYTYGSQVIVTGNHGYLATINDEQTAPVIINTPVTNGSAQNYSFCNTNGTILYCISELDTQAHYQLRESFDNGNNWQTMFDTTNFLLLAFKMFTPSFGIAAGVFGEMVITNDAGKTWAAQRPDKAVDQYTCISGLSDSLVILGGTEGGVGYFYVSRDQGNTWAKSAAINSADYNFVLTSIQFVDENTIMASGIDRVTLHAFTFRSYDGGSTWTSGEISSKSGVYDLEFINQNEGYAVGANFNTDTTALILKTTDGGNTWTEIKNPFTTLLTSIVFTGSSEAIIAGANGMLVKWDMATATGIEAIDMNRPVTLYPNPATAQINYIVPQLAPHTTATVVSLNGQVMLRDIPVENSNSAINISQLPAGPHLLVFQDGDQTTTTKFLKQ